MKKKVVIKLGGSALGNQETLNELAALVRGLRDEDKDVVLVHGGGPAINADLTARGIEWKFINGQRQTTPAMMSVIDEVLSKKVNSRVVNAMLESQIPAMGLSGARDKILLCSQLNEELMRVGQVEQVHIKRILECLDFDNSPLPVIAPVGYSSRKKFNVNADWAATKIAVALEADELIFLTDQFGIWDENKNPMREASPERLNSLIAIGVISGGMFTKVSAMLQSLEMGVGQVRVLHAGQASQLLIDKRVGTLLKVGIHEYAG
jgi:acetylglutamate kinase